MFRELVQLAGRLWNENKLPPTGYKPKSPKWIIELDEGTSFLEGPYTKGELRLFPSPDRQRSGKASKDNLKPYLLVDDARYALARAEPGKEAAAELLHRGFISLLKQAQQETGRTEFALITDFLGSKKVEGVRNQVEPRDLIAFRVKGMDLAEAQEVQNFWARYLEKELVSENIACCSVCGKDRPVIRLLPREVVVLGQKCQMASFNRGAFLSFGKEQTSNASLCFECASSAVDALDYLVRADLHHRALVVGTGGGGLGNLFAVFWLRSAVAVSFEGGTYHLEDLLGLILGKPSNQASPQPELSQVEALLATPWSAKEVSLNLDEERFYLAVLSTNKGRLIVREWLEASLAEVRSNLRSFLQATHIVSPWGDSARPLSIATLIQAVQASNPNLSRGLLRTAYLGRFPPTAILESAVRRLRIPTTLQDPRENWRSQALVSVIKLCLFYGKKEVEHMEGLNPDYVSPPYLCGRLLAVLEEAQLRASGFKLNRTVVDRFYGAASTAPAATFSGLIRLATTAHLREVGKTVNELMEKVMAQLDGVGGFPKTLTLAQQAEFALGFYHQRADFRAGRGKGKEATVSEEGDSDAERY